MASEPDISSDDFLRHFADSGLSGIEDARAIAEDLDPTTGSRIASRLVSNGTLTIFQARAILRGKAAEIRMGNYEVLDKLGVGGMGTVYKARHRRMKRIVALKVLSKAIAQTAILSQRFQREVETIAKLQHPNIVMAFDADEAEEGPFLIMEFVDGRDLGGEIADGGPFSVADAVDCILQAARGLECAHQQGIVHRDIKPSNLMRDRSGVVKVTDLGLARLSADHEGTGNFSLTQSGSVLGTVDYIAPEQAIDSTAVDPRADTYSLGGTLYFLLTGEPPFQAGSIMAMLLKHREAPIPRLREKRADVPARLEEIYLRMMAKTPAERMDMTELIAELEELKRTQALSDSKTDLTTGSLGSASAGGQTMIFSETPAEETPTLPDSPKASTPIVVLVEPSRTQAGIVRQLLEQLGIASVHIAKSGFEALALAQSVGANVIFSSLHLKDMTGVQLAQKMLADSKCSEIGFVLASSESDAQELSALPTSNRFTRLVKPFDLPKLRQAIESITPRVHSR